MKTVLITGASSGIGYELAKVFAKNNYNLILVARRKERLENLKNEILKNNSNTQVYIIDMDLSIDKSSYILYNKTKSLNLDVDILVNNAGIGIYKKIIEFKEKTIDKNRKMINLNINTVVELTRLYLEDMVKRNNGKILNVASIGAFFPSPFMSTYYASKSFVLSFTDAIREEINNKQIQISTLCPGPTITEFEKSDTNYNKTLFSRFTVMSAEKVAKISYNEFIIKSKKTIIVGFTNKLLILFSKIVPRVLIVKLVKRIQEKKNIK